MHHTPPGPLGDCLRDWEELQQDFQSIQETHRLYRLKLEELTKLQSNCTGSITRQKKQLQELTLGLKKCKPSLPVGAEEAAQELENQIKERQGLFFDMESYLPKKNGLYLSLVLGNVNVTLLSKQAKFAYKDEYEKFKLYLTIILILISFTCRFLLNSRVTDAAFNFLLVWYYCTLTIRESILINNGSRIKGWWVFHHYVSTFLSGVMLTWPDGLMYQKFRNQFLSFSMYQILMPPHLQALCSSSSITTRAAVCTGCGPWARGTLWTSLWRASSPGCGGASPSCCPFFSLDISGSFLTR
ncbi:PREDICTED: transmembrane protein 120A isoform X2 [Hipposideros armiger]|uniref:Transmembrane protein 120A isoform X2 n=1 Tax=Hipposideros armiger TaxID=186990 RepID=A0A8B7RQ12_HIPAR|nr:PREDICTED: transmembrane protein 120A isoform X2 [Hipposideros armiger]